VAGCQEQVGKARGAEDGRAVGCHRPQAAPELGATRFPNLFLATGHGTLGWTMAAGTGRVIADLMSGQSPAIDMDGLTVARYPNAYR
jgi:D-amino-acid dehydrogenase